MKIRPYRLLTTAILLWACIAAHKAEASAAPSIDTQPQSQTNYYGSNIVFTVVASGQTPLFYQWLFYGTNLSDNGHISGSSTSNLTVNSITTNDVGNYQVVVSNSHGSVPSSNATLTVLVPAGITIQPTNQSVVFSNNVTITAAATGTSPLNYRWYFNGSPLADGGRVSGSGTANLNISNVETNDAGPYQLVVTNNYGLATSAVATLTVEVPPIIFGGSLSQSVLVNTNTAFGVFVSGTAPLSYQWYFNGGLLTDSDNIRGSTTSLLYLLGVQTNNAGSYQCIITNDYGTATSAVMVLTVLDAPRITSGPLDQAVSIGNTAFFSVSAAGSGPLTYQWQENGTNLMNGGRVSGVSGSVLTISNVQFSDGGNYGVVVSNSVGVGVSREANLAVVPIVVWGYGGNNETNIPSAATNALAITGEDYHNAALLSDGTVIEWGVYKPYFTPPTAPPELSNVVAIAAGSDFDLALQSDGTVVGWGTNDYGQLNIPASLTNIVAIAAGAFESLALRSDGTVVAWGDNSVGETNVPAGLNNVIAIAASDFQNMALRSDGTVVGWGDNEFGQTNPPPGLSGVVGIAAGAYHSLALRNDGTVAAWGWDVDGETNVPVGLSNVVAVSAGYYQSLALQSDGSVVAWGDDTEGETNVPPGLGNVVSIAGAGYNSLALVQNPATQVPPSIWWQGSTNLALTIGQPAVISPYLSGSLPINFQWYFNGAPLPGQTNKWLALTSIQAGQFGGYQFVATNAYGSVTGQVITVAQLPMIVTQPANQQIVLGGTATFTAEADGQTPLGYQWYFNGTPLTDGARVNGSATTNLSITNVQVADAGPYQLVVTNNAGTATSAVVTLTVDVPASIAVQPTNVTLVSGVTARFYVTPGGTSPFGYLWYSNGIALTNIGRIFGATSSNLSLSSVQTNDSGTTYQVVVTNNYGAATSAVVTLTVLNAAKITSQPASQAVLLGGNVSFAITATGSGLLNYQWYYNGTQLTDNARISGSSTPMLSIVNVQSTDIGGYVAVVTNLASSATSWTASLTPQAVLAPSTRYVALTSTNPSPPYLDWTTAATNIQDAIDAAVPGDSVIVSNGNYASGIRALNGGTNRVAIYKALTVQSVSGPAATLITGARSDSPPEFAGMEARCVYLTNGATLSGFTLTNGGTIDSANIISNSGGGALCESGSVMISNCIFVGNAAHSFGGGAFRGTLINCLLTNNTAPAGGGAASNSLFNCMVISNTAANPAGSSGTGGGAYGSSLNNCIVSGNRSSGSTGNAGGAAFGALSNCIVTANTTGNDGGGSYYSTNYDCIFSNNSAVFGGGVFGGVVKNSLISSNSASNSGGGACSNTLTGCILLTNRAELGGGADMSVLSNCTVVLNSAIWGGGTINDKLYNCVIYFNSAGSGANWYAGADVTSNCCTMPLPPGIANITNDPAFVNLAGGDLHLSSTSPCINSGNNVYGATATDFDGNPRIVGGTVDIGAYEYQTPASVISYAWLQQYGLPTDGSVDYADLDGTGFNVYQDWIADLNPTNSASVLAMQAPVANTNSIGLIVSWLSVSDRTYYLQRATNLAAQPAFSTVQSNISGQAGTTSFTDTTATNGGPYFYRVGVQQ